jgi:hypothetical protein
MSRISVDPEVIEHIIQSGTDFRVSTDCSGPVLMPIEFKAPKESDLRIKIGDHTLYISRVQARYIDRVTMDMLYTPSRGASCILYQDL